MRTLNDRDAVRPLWQALLVVTGYVLALVVAAAVVGIYVAAVDSPERQASSGMSAFGDAMVFLVVFGLAAIPATGAALFFLRPYRAVWRAGAVAALCIAMTGIAALIDTLVRGSADTGSFLGAWSVLSSLRVLVAPLLAIGFFLSAIFAPARSYRGAFLGATVSEVVVFVWVVLIWVHPFQ